MTTYRNSKVNYLNKIMLIFKHTISAVLYLKPIHVVKLKKKTNLYFKSFDISFVGHVV